DSIALQRVINSPPRGIGKQTLDEVSRRANDYGLSLWETIALVIEKPEGLSLRSISALKSFRKLILRLGKMAGIEGNAPGTHSQEAQTSELGSQVPESQGQEKRLAPAPSSPSDI